MAHAFNDDKSKHDISDVTSLISRIEELERQVGSLSGDITNLGNNIDAVERQVDDFSGDLTNLSNDVDAMSVIGTHYES